MPLSPPLSDRRRIGRRTFLLLPLWALAGPAAAQEILSFDGLYASFGVLGLKYSPRALALRGQRVRLRGYMAPPLKPDSHFFVLTREAVSVCPFCAADAEWPVDIVVVYLKRTLAPADPSRRIEVEGRLEIGSLTDPQTGFVSQVRLVDAEVHA